MITDAEQGGSRWPGLIDERSADRRRVNKESVHLRMLNQWPLPSVWEKCWLSQEGDDHDRYRRFGTPGRSTDDRDDQRTHTYPVAVMCGVLSPIFSMDAPFVVVTAQCEEV